MFHVIISAHNDAVLHSTQYPVRDTYTAALWATRQGEVGYALNDTEEFLRDGYGLGWCEYTGDPVFVTCHEVETNIFTSEGK